ncbi:MAG: phosphate acyltransferase PlsX [Clostridia bacterium]|nr:phosphate acyltransferase PlsX [Clostridia bacterium]
MIKIVLDCFGGDNSPKANVDGAIHALMKNHDLHLILTGDEATIRGCLWAESLSDRIEIVHAPDVITGEDKPTEAIKRRKESSLVKGLELLRENDDIAGIVSIGATGAVLAGTVLRLGRIKGVLRPAFCPILPTMHDGIVGVCDSGANVDCKPAYLKQFAIMGSVYLRSVYGVENPKVALLNVGVESEKGGVLHQEAYELLKACDSVNFVGNMESRDLLSGKYDLVVCDGFSGNVLLKATEGACLETLGRLKRGFGRNLRTKLGALLLKKMLMEEKRFLDYQNYGGSILAGAKKIVVKGHGSSKATGVEKCIEQAYKMASSGYCQEVERALLESKPEE